MKKILRQFGLELLLLLQLAIFAHFFGNSTGENPSIFRWWFNCIDPKLPMLFLCFMALGVWDASGHSIRAGTLIVSGGRSGWVTGTLCSLFAALAVFGYIWGFPEVSNLALFGLMGSVLRLRVTRLLLFMLMGSCFSPQWLFGFLSPPLQKGFAVILESLLSGSGVEVVRNGTGFIFGNDSGFRIAEECSGVRGLEILFFLAVQMAVCDFIRPKGLLLIVVSALGCAFFTNLMRVLIIAGCAVAGGQELWRTAHDGWAPQISFIFWLLIHIYLSHQIRRRNWLPPPDEVDESYQLLRHRGPVFAAASVMLFLAAGLCWSIDARPERADIDWPARAMKVQVVGERWQDEARFCDDRNFQCLMSSPLMGIEYACACGNPVPPHSGFDLLEFDPGVRKLRLHYGGRIHSDIGVTLVEGWRAEQPVCNPTWFLRNEASGNILSIDEREIVLENGCTGRVSVVCYDLPKRTFLDKVYFGGYSGTMLYGFSDGQTLYANRMQYRAAVWRRQMHTRKLSPDMLLVMNMRHAQNYDALDELRMFTRSYLAQLTGDPAPRSCCASCP
jgi:exosortase/archaeosortase family protein